MEKESSIREEVKINLVFKYRKPKLRKADLIAEKKRLQNLLYFYVQDESMNKYINSRLRYVENELRVLEEQKRKV